MEVRCQVEYFWRRLGGRQGCGSECLIMRWILKGKMKSCGKGVFFYGKTLLTGAENVEIGNNVHVGENGYIRGEGGLKIGDNVHISRNLVLYSMNHCYQGRCLPFDDTLENKPVVIGDNVWIGMNVCIAPGSEIGDGALISMGSVVYGKVPAMAVVGNGNLKVIKYRDEEHYQKLLKEKAFGGRSGKPLGDL